MFPRWYRNMFVSKEEIEKMLKKEAEEAAKKAAKKVIKYKK